MLIPLVSGYFIYTGRKEIFSNVEYSYVTGATVIGIGSILYIIGRNQGADLDANDFLSIMTFAAVTSWTGGFIFFYGVSSFRAALFPLLFLIFMVPVPGFIMERIIHFLQFSSATAANMFFTLTGVTFVREGTVFHLPGLSIEVAEQCSGIRSGLSLFITSVIAGHLFLNSGSRKVILALVAFPIAIVKNGMRIVTLSLLGLYVDPGILAGPIHKKGGIPFFIIGLMIMGLVLVLLRKSEAAQKSHVADKR
jgi:exosortase